MARLGLHADAANQRLRLVRPTLPDWLEMLELRGLCVGAHPVDIVVRRSADGSLDVEARGDGKVAVEQVKTADDRDPPP